jgi:hypothetical protein
MTAPVYPGPMTVGYPAPTTLPIQTPCGPQGILGPMSSQTADLINGLIDLATAGIVTFSGAPKTPSEQGVESNGENLAKQAQANTQHLKRMYGLVVGGRILGRIITARRVI